MIGIGIGPGFGSKVKPFAPSALSGLQLWLRADKGITQGSGVVSAWADQSGIGDSNRNVAEASLKPTFNSAGTLGNNQPSLTFGTNTKLRSGTWSVALAQPLSVCIVAKQTTTGSTKYAFDNLSDPTQCFIYGQAPTAVIDYGNPTDNAATANTAVPQFYIVEYSGTASNIYVSSNTHAGASQNAGTGGIQGTSIGNYAGGGNFAGWEIGEVIIVNRIMSANDVAKLNAYVAARYGIAIN